MKAAILILATAAALWSSHAVAARVPDAQWAMKFDLYACGRPAYPAGALAQGVGGRVAIDVRVGERGEVLEARVAASSGRADLDDAALAGIRKCAFHAVLATGQAPTGWLTTRYAWMPGTPRQAQDRALYTSTHALAAQGDAGAQNRIGTWHEHGILVDKDLAQAAAWYRLAADGGNAYAQNNLGVLYHRGAGVPGDRQQAIHWYAQAAEQGHGWAQANLAWGYQRGAGVEQDMEQALYWLTRSAEGGLTAAQVRLGLLAIHRAAADDERAEGAAWLARAAALNDPAGHYYLGRSFELGLGNAQDDARAAAAYRKAFGRSGGRAETALGTLIEAGRVDEAAPGEALTLYEAAMQSRDPSAFYRYGLALEARGDSELATALFMHGARLGSCEAAIKSALLLQASAPADSPRLNPRFTPHLGMCVAPLEAAPRF